MDLQLHPKRLDRLWECLEGTIRACPEECRKRLILAAMIIHMNDDHRWDRERIAAWVAGSGGTPVRDLDANANRELLL